MAAIPPCDERPDAKVEKHCKYLGCELLGVADGNIFNYSVDS